MKRIFIFSITLVLLLTGCMLRPVHVPPEAFSLSSALKVIQDSYSLMFIDDVDGYENIQAKGMIALYNKGGKTFLVYAFKFYDESPRKYWNRVAKNFGIWSCRTYIDLPTSGLYSTRSSGKEIVSWWKNRWLFIVEGKENTEQFASYMMDTFAKIGGRFNW